MATIPLPLLIAVLRFTGRTRKFRSAADLHREIAKERRGFSPEPPAAIARSHAVSREDVLGCPVYTLAPKQGGSATRVMHLHGGAYVSGISPFHWRFLAGLVDATGCTVTIPIYPLAPEASHREAFPFVTEVYRRLAAVTAPENLVLSGDSAGGGLALALAQTLPEHHLPQPRDIVMISPWLEVTARNPGIAAVQPHDPWLKVPGALEAARLWAAGEDHQHPRISPINGPVRGLGRLHVWIGQRDILLPDCRDLRDRCAREGVPLASYTEAPGMIHVWPILPIRGAHRAAAEIARVVRG
ncbi:alpha/beta hydrolase fold domain-containing protein [Ferrovibrio sp.]|uniref:alpha/beta hydrolase fold domain-containing protein n=1 Tax=Ferrovibrio sp. TaxID=1917215 RepID=UPI0035166964